MSINWNVKQVSCGNLLDIFMKKKITVILEIESDDEFMMNDEFIKSDLMAEINCASNSYDFISIDIEKMQLKTQGEADD